MKVLMIDPSGSGGISHYTYNLCNSLAHVCDDVLLVTSNKYELDSLKRDFRVQKVLLPTLFFMNYFRLWKIIQKERPQITHIQALFLYPTDWLFLTAIKAILNRKLVYTAHNVLPHEPLSHHLFSLKHIYKTVDQTITHTGHSKQEISRLFDIPLTKIIKIPFGNYLFLAQDIKYTQEAAKKMLGIKKDESVVLFFGFIREYKGLDILIKAFRLVCDRLPNAKLLIAGKCLGNFSPYSQLISDLKLEDSVILKLEYIPFDKLPIYFQASDVVALPYKRIYQSAIVYTAWAFKKPLVVTDIGGLSEVIETEKSGILIPPENVEELSKAIISILSNKQKAIEMGVYGREISRTRFSWELIANKTVTIYKKLLDK